MEKNMKPRSLHSVDKGGTGDSVVVWTRQIRTSRGEVLSRAANGHVWVSGSLVLLHLKFFTTKDQADVHGMSCHQKHVDI